MDKRKLTGDELAQLRNFIVSRSRRFAEPGILLEITDHFACKTEELLNEEPALSLQQAIKKAHHSFGIKGFAPIAEAYEQHTYLHYKRFSQQTQLSILLSWHSLGLLCIGIFFTRLYSWLSGFHLVFGNGHEAIILPELLYAGGVALLLLQRKNVKKHQLTFGLAYEASQYIFGWLWLGLILLPLQDELPQAYLATLTGCLASFLSFQLLSLWRLITKVNSDVQAIEQQLQHNA